MKRIVLSFWILVMMFSIVFKVVSGGSPLSNQQLSGNFGAGSTSIGNTGNVSESYPMGSVGMVYGGDSWSLAGYSVISRSSKDGVPSYNNELDTFYLGGEELIRIKQLSGQWEYRTKQESMRRIFLIDPTAATAKWRVYNPDGSIDTYAKRFVGKSFPVLTPRAWGITESISRGKYDTVKYEYYEDVSEEILLKRIVSGKTGQIPDKMTYIEYGWTAVYQKSNASSGELIRQAHFPRIVYTFSGTERDPFTAPNYYWIGKTDVWQYNDGTHGKKKYYLDGAFLLDWQFGEGGEWQLKKVTPCGANVTMYLEGRYGNGILRDTILITSNNNDTTLNPTCYYYYTYRDVNNKIPFSAFVSIPDSAFGASAPDFLSDDNTSLADVNGDGLLDIVRKNNGTYQMDVWYNRYDRDTNTMSFDYRSFTMSDLRRLNHEGGLYDWNHDGKADRVLTMVIGTRKELWVYYNIDGYSFSTTEKIYDQNWEEFIKSDITYNHINKTPLDMDGDGEPDKVIYDQANGNFNVAFHKTGYNPAAPFGNYGDKNSGHWPRQFGEQRNKPGKWIDTVADLFDINGDGLPDSIIKNNEKMRVKYNLGQEFLPSGNSYYTLYSDPDTSRLVDLDLDNSGNMNVVFDYMDVNGDGLLDRVKKNLNDAGSVWFNLGMGFSTEYRFASISNDSRAFEHKKLSFPTDPTVAFYADMNGDGLPDRVVKDAPGSDLKIAYNLLLSNGAHAGRLKTVVGPNGGSITYRYQALNKLYNKDCKPNLIIVKEKEVWDGLMDWYYPDKKSEPLITKYEFTGGNYVSVMPDPNDPTDLSKKIKVREFRGFSLVREIMPTGDYTHTGYHVGENTDGQPIYILSYDSNGNYLSKTQYFKKVYTPLMRQIYDPDYSSRIILVLPYAQHTEIYKGDTPGPLPPIMRKTIINYQYDFGTTGDDLGYITNVTTENLGETDSSGNDIGNDYVRTETTLLNYTQLPNGHDEYLVGLDSRTDIYDEPGTGYPAEAGMNKEYYYSANQPGRLLRETTQWDGTNYVNPIKYYYNIYGNNIAVMNAKDKVTTTSYDSTYNKYPVLTLATDSYSGSTISYKTENIYNERLRVASVKNHEMKVGDTSSFAESKTWYDDFGRPAAQCGPLGSYDPRNPSQIQNLDKQIQYGKANIELNEGYLLGKIDPNTPAYVKTYNLIDYGKWDRLWTLSCLDGLGRTIQVKTSPDNSDNGVNAKVTRTQYKRSTNKTIVINYVPFGVNDNTARLNMPVGGESSARIDAWSYVDGPSGLITKIRKPDNSLVETRNYNWVTTGIDEEGKTTTSEVDGSGRVIKMTDADNTETKYFYNSATGNLLRIEAAGNKTIPGINTPIVTLINYNKLGQKTDIYDPDMGHHIYTYDVLGNIETIADDLGTTTVNEYDDLNRLRKATVTRGTNIDETVTVYDDVSAFDEGYAKGMPVKITSKSNGKTESVKLFSYDLAQRVIRAEHKIYHSGTYNIAAMGYEYNAAGQITKKGYPDGEVVVYEYNQQNGMEKAVRKQDYSCYYANNTVYAFPYSKVSKTTYGNGVTTDYQYYDAADNFRLKRIAFNKSGVLDHWQEYTYYDSGNIEKINDKNPSYSQEFRYDNLYRLTYARGIYDASGYTYDYDAIGNMRLKEGVSLQYNDPDHVHAVTYTAVGTSFTYDAVGNMTGKIMTTPTSSRKYTYNTANMLTEVKDANNTVKFTAAYTGEERVKLVENGITTLFFFPEYTMKKTGTGVVTEYNYYFSNGQRIAERERKEAISKLYYYHKDHLGSTIRMTNENGESKNSTYYKPYGEELVQAGSMVDPDYTFNDKQSSDNGDLYYYGAKFYDPEEHVLK